MDKEDIKIAAVHLALAVINKTKPSDKSTDTILTEAQTIYDWLKKD